MFHRKILLFRLNMRLPVFLATAACRIVLAGDPRTEPAWIEHVGLVAPASYRINSPFYPAGWATGADGTTSPACQHRADRLSLGETSLRNIEPVGARLCLLDQPQRVRVLGRLGRLEAGDTAGNLCYAIAIRGKTPYIYVHALEP